MSSKLPKGWEKDSETLYVHPSGVRIQLMTYRAQEGWMLVPTDLDQAVVPFDPTPEGRDKAFAAYADGVLNTKPKKVKVSKKKKEKTKSEATEPEEKKKVPAGEAGEDEEGEEEEAEEGDEG